MLTCIQIAWSFAAYTLVVLGLPWLVLHKRLTNLPTEARWMGYFLFGNFYIINWVFALQFLHISNRVTLLLGTILPFAIPYLWKRRYAVHIRSRNMQKQVLQYLKGERKLKTTLRQRYGHMNYGTYRKIARWMKKNGLEIFCFFLLMVAVFYEYGLDTVQFYGYKASDVVVHNYWINLMDENKIFHAGVYPHGFHCVIYYLEQVFGIPTYVLLRVFSLVETFYIHLALLIPLRAFCKNRYLPYLSVIGYALLPCLEYNTYWRYTATLPQEYGMLFIVPSCFFAMRFFQDYKRKLDEQTADVKKILAKTVQYDLAFFAIGFSLSITVHFYDTMIAGLFCVAIALVYWREILKWDYFWRIIGVGILSIAIAVMPMVIGVMQGNKLQGSLYWGLNVLNGNKQSEQSVASEQEAASEEKKEDVLNTDNQENQLTISDKLEQLRNRIEKNAVGTGKKYRKLVTYGMILGWAILLVAGWGEVLLHKSKCQAEILWNVGWFDFLMLLLMEAPLLHLPSIMDGNRASIFFNYIQVLVLGLGLDSGIDFLLPQKIFGWRWSRASVLVIIIGLTGVALRFQWIRPICKSYEFESNQAMTCTANIIRENKQFDWTICSANEERQMILSVGRHEELITFLRTLKKSTESAVSLKIPTHYIYFYVEKMPIPYAGVLTGKKENKISEKDAEQPLNMESGLTPYEGENRWVTMAHIYYWVQAFQKLHPDAIEVYYEDDEFVCYKLTQNVDSLYELAIDYGYNE